jgi:3-isopropylmalate/(R)-2-methylmalate dehydratase large subunit
MSQPRTLFGKIWQNHIVAQEPDSPALLYIDLHLVHEVTSPQAFSSLRERGLKVRRPDKTMATIDHSLPTLDRSLPIRDELAAKQITQMENNCRDFGIHLYGREHPSQGIVHVIGPELGLTQPGKTIVCGDSHTATHGAFGALAFGIGTSEVEHVLATQCLLQSKPGNCEVRIDGALGPGLSAKDVILALIAQIGIGGGVGYVFEYTGSAVRALTMEGRMTLCNMSIEAGARAGLVAPDQVTFDYLYGREFSPKGAAWDQAVMTWSEMPTEAGAAYDKNIRLDVSQLEPMITFGTNPGMGMKISARIPDPDQAESSDKKALLDKALHYMDLRPGEPLLGHPVDVVFIGSCTNGRMADLRSAASLMQGRHVAAGTRVLVVPGSMAVKRQAEAEGLDKIFKEAGAEWRQPGCSMCIAMNGDQIEPGQYAVSTSNRNFEGRQGKGGRTFLASPLTAAATAINGKISDPRTLLSNPNPSITMT